jgi:4-hydroxythreonine-4-phosphate dehydrogenase
MSVNLALTPGEPAGVGPDITIQLAQTERKEQIIVFADPDMLETRAKLLNLPIKLKDVVPNFTAAKPGELSIVPVRASANSQAGILDPSNSGYVLECLDRAIEACESEFCHAMVTGPVQKSVISGAGFHFRGHTEYLAKKTNTESVVMMLATEKLRVALVTTHIPLKDVAASITKQLLTKVIKILYSDLQRKFNIEHPQIIVSGLNPHAGENGHLGYEEIEVIKPVIEQLNLLGMNLIGPIPADTLFTAKYLNTADAILTMFHDQGLPVLKHQGFGKAANITLGLPIIRTSVDHGTALDIAGSGLANMSSLKTAINVAVKMATRK